MDFSIWQIAIVLVIALLVFGPKRLPELARSAGHGMREFKDSVAGGGKDDATDDDEDQSEPTVIESTATPEPAAESDEADAPQAENASEERRVEEHAVAAGRS